MIVLITGPSGAGKSSFIAELMAADQRLAFSVSTTTRPMRSGEVDGRDYDFVDEPAFDRLVAESAFVEWAQVHDNRYGTRRSQLEEMTAAGKIPVLDIDVQGGVQVLDQFGSELVSVFLFPPSWEELDRRLTSRGTDEAEVIATRLRNARHEVSYAPRYRYWIVNDDLAAAVARMRAVIAAEECRSDILGTPPLESDTSD
ncbi:MAG: guanylate kinase [Candidatus Krumholzibacteria bacterium]|nr:guanylate kinase [Candidatus Krumholzibacteria bacterium]